MPKIFITICGVTAVALIGDNTLAYEVLFILILIDTLTGVMISFIDKRFSSRRSFQGLKKLFLFFVLVISAHQITKYTSIKWLEDAIVFYCAANEMLSIIENVHKLGVPVPRWIVEKLEIYRETGQFKPPKI